MESLLKFAVIVSVVALVSLGFAEKPVAVSAEAKVSVGDANAASLPEMPFVAEITSDDVYVRSGAGTNYYYCGKLKKGDKVKVVGSRYSWLQVVPPAGSYAWISKQYVEVDSENSASGTVIGDGVRVYAGSDDVQPMHSTSLLVKLNKDDKVVLFGEEKESYYKIAPPEGAYLWVSNQYAKPLGSLVSPPQPAPATATLEPFPQAVSPNEPATPLFVDEQKTREVMLLKEQVEAEQAKPIEQQDFSELKKRLMKIVNDKQSPKAARNAQHLLNAVERCELASKVSKAVKLQEQQFSQTQQRIENARAAKLADFEDLSIYAVIGKLAESTIFAEAPGIKYYRIVDNEGKTVCYARAANEALNLNVSKFIDKKVGLVGAIEPKAELGGALVQFTNIVEVR
jgi:uncharacterized protein YgiM (DUF1202 family)